MLEIDLELASEIQARAQERGMSVDVYLLELMTKDVIKVETGTEFSARERVRSLREWAAEHNANTPLLSDAAIRRDSIYGERG